MRVTPLRASLPEPSSGVCAPCKHAIRLEPAVARTGPNEAQTTLFCDGTTHEWIDFEIHSFIRSSVVYHTYDY